MPKGKKYTAAEKHFNEKAADLRRLIRSLELDNMDLMRQKRDAEIKVISLESENEQLRAWVERLLEFTELSKEELKTLCDRANATKTFMDLMGVMQSLTGLY